MLRKFPRNFWTFIRWVRKIPQNSRQISHQISLRKIKKIHRRASAGAQGELFLVPHSLFFKARSLQCECWPRSSQILIEKLAMNFLGGCFPAVFSKEKGPNNCSKKSPAKFIRKFVQINSPRISAEAFSWLFLKKTEKILREGISLSFLDDSIGVIGHLCVATLEIGWTGIIL